MSKEHAPYVEQEAQGRRLVGYYVDGTPGGTTWDSRPLTDHARDEWYIRRGKGPESSLFHGDNPIKVTYIEAPTTPALSLGKDILTIIPTTHEIKKQGTEGQLAALDAISVEEFAIYPDGKIIDLGSPLQITPGIGNHTVERSYTRRNPTSNTFEKVPGHKLTLKDSGEIFISPRKR